MALGNLSWAYSVNVNASYNRSLGADRTTYISRGASSHLFMAPAACYAQNLVATDGEVTEAATADACPLTATRTQLCRRFDACGAGHAVRLSAELPPLAAGSAYSASAAHAAA